MKEKVISCGGFIWLNRTKLLIARPSWYDTEWNIPKGRVDPGEDYAVQTALREIYEETNILLTHENIKREIGLFPYTKRKNLYLFEFDIVGEAPDTKCNSFFIDFEGKKRPEMVDFKWVDLETAIKMVHPGIARILQKVYGWQLGS